MCGKCEQAWQVFFLIYCVCNQILIHKSVVRFIPFLSKRGDWDDYARIAKRLPTRQNVHMYIWNTYIFSMLDEKVFVFWGIQHYVLGWNWKWNEHESNIIHVAWCVHFLSVDTIIRYQYLCCLRIWRQMV